MGKFYGPKYGRRAYQNIEWKYNFKPIAKWATILLGAVTLAGLIWTIRQEILNREKNKIAQIEAVQEREAFLKRKLETVKQKTIAAENRKIEARQGKSSEPRKPRQYTGPKLYSWVNENGQTVYSNKPKPE